VCGSSGFALLTGSIEAVSHILATGFEKAIPDILKAIPAILTALAAVFAYLKTTTYREVF
jgi:hypothetical protein